MKNHKSEPALEETTAYERAALEGIDPRCIPQILTNRAPEDQDINYPYYSDEEHDRWKLLYERQMSFLQGRACNEYLEGVQKLSFTPEKIPALKELSTIFKQTTGWKIARVPGLIHEKDFFEMLRRKVFPSTDYIRGENELDYTPAPDLFHDIFGHMPMLTNPDFASFYSMFGKAALKAEGIIRKQLETFHWFTAEFGLIKQSDGMRIYGAGIVSSLGEVQHALSENVEVINFDVEKIITQDYDVWHLQPVLFYIDSFEQLEKGFTKWVKRLGLT